MCAVEINPTSPLQKAEIATEFQNIVFFSLNATLVETRESGIFALLMNGKKQTAPLLVEKSGTFILPSSYSHATTKQAQTQ